MSICMHRNPHDHESGCLKCGVSGLPSTIRVLYKDEHELDPCVDADPRAQLLLFLFPFPRASVFMSIVLGSSAAFNNAIMPSVRHGAPSYSCMRASCWRSSSNRSTGIVAAAGIDTGTCTDGTATVA